MGHRHVSTWEAHPAGEPSALRGRRLAWISVPRIPASLPPVGCRMSRATGSSEQAVNVVSSPQPFQAADTSRAPAEAVLTSP